MQNQNQFNNKLSLRLIRVLTIVNLLCFLGLSLSQSETFASPQASKANRWTTDSLNGVQTFHSGPNCLNGVMAGKGIIDNLVYIDSVEMRFILDNYCDLKTSPAVAGDIIAVIREGTIEHGAIFLNQQQIFEKHSTAALYGPYPNSKDSVYKKISRLDSEYFTQDQNVRKIENYSCQPSVAIRTSLENVCTDKEMLNLVLQMRKSFENISLTKTQNLNNVYVPRQEIFRFIEKSDKLNGTDLCSTYLFSIGVSTLGSIYHLNQELSTESDLLHSLMTTLLNLKAKIESANPAPKTQKIMSEFRWAQ